MIPYGNREIDQLDQSCKRYWENAFMKISYKSSRDHWFKRGTVTGQFPFSKISYYNKILHEKFYVNIADINGRKELICMQNIIWGG